MIRVNMKILLCFILGLLFISCKDSNVNPIRDPEPCEVPMFGIGMHIAQRYIPLGVTKNHQKLFYTGYVDSNLHNVYIFDLNSKTHSIIQGNRISDYKNGTNIQKVLVCPYDSDIILIVSRVISKDLTPQNGLFNAYRYLRYSIPLDSIIDVTPSQYFETGIPRNLGIVPVTWLNSSSINNDLLDCGTNGIFHLQSGNVIETRSKPYPVILSVSVSGKYKVMINSSTSKIFLNDIPITNQNESKNFAFSHDEKFLAYSSDRIVDSLYLFKNFWATYFVDIQKTLKVGEVQFVNTIYHSKTFCSFRSNYEIIFGSNNETLIISLGRFTMESTPNLYEIDFNGKILRQLTNE